jgi:hypothetical protein
MITLGAVTAFLLLAYTACFLLGMRNVFEIIIRQGRYKSIYLLTEYIFSQLVLMFRLMSFTTMAVLGPTYFTTKKQIDEICSPDTTFTPWLKVPTSTLIFMIESVNLSMAFKLCLMVSLTAMFCMLACKVSIIEELRGMERWSFIERNIQLAMGSSFVLSLGVAIASTVYLIKA